MAEDPSPLQALADMPAPPRAGENWTSFVSVMQELRSGKAGWPAEIGLVREWYQPHLERLHEDATTRQADLLQLEQIAGGYPSRERFLTELTLDPPDATSDQAGVPLLDEDYLILSTIHSAKGQEWTNGLHVERCRRLHSVGSRRWHQRRKSRRSGACFMSR